MSPAADVHPAEPSWNRQQVSYWSHLSYAYDGYYTSRWSELENECVATRLRFIERYSETPRILDLGCGTGLGAALAAKWVRLDGYVGVDIAPEMAELTCLSHGVETRIGAMDELDWVSSETIDAIICLFSAGSFARSPEQLFTDIFRVLKPGGRAYVSTLGRDILCRPREIRFRTRGHRVGMTAPARRFRVRHLCELAHSAGLHVETIEGMNSLSGILEAPWLWTTGRALARIWPNTSHLLDIRCLRPGLA